MPENYAGWHAPVAEGPMLMHVDRRALIAFAGGVVMLIASGALRFRGHGALAWLCMGAGIALVAFGVARLHRARPKDDPFRRFAAEAFLADPRSPLFCACGHELRHHTFRGDTLQCTRCDDRSCAVITPDETPPATPSREASSRSGDGRS